MSTPNFSFFRFSRGSKERGEADASPLLRYTVGLRLLTSLRLVTTMPVRAKRAMTLGRTMKLLNISVTSQTKSLPEIVPMKMNASAITV